jgi:transcription elongation factor Elf1
MAMVEAFHCNTCGRSFSSASLLAQHLRDSPVHAPTFDCNTCDRSFFSASLLAQHLQDSPVHAPTFDCNTCNRSFSSVSLMAQHLRGSPVHAPALDCNTCDRSFVFPLLSQDIVSAVSDKIASPRFYKDNSDSGACNRYATHVIGEFKCNNNAC